MKIIICDDECAARTSLKRYVEKYADEFDDLKIEEFLNGEELILSLNEKNDADIIFLDIEMSKRYRCCKIDTHKRPKGNYNFCFKSQRKGF